MRLNFPVVALFLVATSVTAAAARERPLAPATPQDAAQVETRATLRLITEEHGGDRVYVHLKIVPRAKLPFSTLRFRVRVIAVCWTGCKRVPASSFVLSGWKTRTPCCRSAPCRPACDFRLATDCGWQG